MLAGNIERVHSDREEYEISFHIDVVVSDGWLVVLIVFYVDGSMHILFYNGSCLLFRDSLYFYCSIELELYGEGVGFHMREVRELFKRHNDMFVT